MMGARSRPNRNRWVVGGVGKRGVANGHAPLIM
jgi:hypothetical protein